MRARDSLPSAFSGKLERPAAVETGCPIEFFALAQANIQCWTIVLAKRKAAFANSFNVLVVARLIRERNAENRLSLTRITRSRNRGGQGTAHAGRGSGVEPAVEEAGQTVSSRPLRPRSRRGGARLRRALTADEGGASAASIFAFRLGDAHSVRLAPLESGFDRVSPHRASAGLIRPLAPGEIQHARPFDRAVS